MCQALVQNIAVSVPKGWLFQQKKPSDITWENNFPYVHPYLTI